jgi:hypothetical protein
MIIGNLAMSYLLLNDQRTLLVNLIVLSLLEYYVTIPGRTLPNYTPPGHPVLQSNWRYGASLHPFKHRPPGRPQ